MCGSVRERRRLLAAGPRLDLRDGVDERRELVDGDAALDRDALEPALLQPADQRAERVRLRDRHVVDDDFVADQADDDRRLERVQQLDRGRRAPSRLRAMIGWPVRVELRRSQRRGEAAQQFVGELLRAARVTTRLPLRAAPARAPTCARAADRTPRDPLAAASSSAASACGVPIRASAAAAAARSAAVRRGAHHSPRYSASFSGATPSGSRSAPSDSIARR